jgi:dTDP-4-dehydrorhamnose 3,5-epimerase
MIEVFDLPIPGAKILKLNRHNDKRGWFTETFRKSWLTEAGINDNFIFDYWSFNKSKNTLRGLHAQSKEAPQSKLISVLNGSIQDVIVDARPYSITYKQHCSIILTKDNPCVVYIPKGCYHGFLTLESNTYVGYKLDNYHDSNSEVGIRWNCEELNIDWLSKKSPITSIRDKNHPFWNDAYKF